MEEYGINVVPDEDQSSTLPDDVVPDEDHISKLPDDVLSSIISLLTIRDAVKTSILSKRWRHFYATLSAVNFDIETMFGLNGDTKVIANKRKMHIIGENHICRKNRPMFVTAVNRFLNQYLGPTLHSFQFSFCSDAELMSCVNHWISLAVRMGVKVLDLNFVCCDCIHDYTMKYYKLFWCHLSGAFDLKHLSLGSCIIVIPDSGYKINGLTTLDLSHVPLFHNELQHIFRSCLNLHGLKVRHCMFPGTLCVSGISRLEVLMLGTCYGLEEIELDAINLTTFECYDTPIKKLRFAHVPKLKKVFFSLLLSRPHCFIEAASNLPQLKRLRISDFLVCQNA